MERGLVEQAGGRWLLAVEGQAGSGSLLRNLLSIPRNVQSLLHPVPSQQGPALGPQ